MSAAYFTSSWVANEVGRMIGKCPLRGIQGQWYLQRAHCSSTFQFCGIGNIISPCQVYTKSSPLCHIQYSTNCFLIFLTNELIFFSYIILVPIILLPLSLKQFSTVLLWVGKLSDLWRLEGGRCQFPLRCQVEIYIPLSRGIKWPTLFLINLCKSKWNILMGVIGNQFQHSLLWIPIFEHMGWVSRFLNPLPNTKKPFYLY